MSRPFLRCLQVIAAMLPLAASAHVIQFDDITSQTRSPELVPAEYAGLHWQGLKVMWRGAYPGSGYETGATSGQYSAWFYSNASFSATQPFTLESLSLSKSWDAGLTRFEGWRGNTRLFSMDVAATPAAATLVQFGWHGIDQVRMAPLSGSQSVIDDVVVSSVPEPASATLLAAGLGVLGLALRRRAV